MRSPFLVIVLGLCCSSVRAQNGYTGSVPSGHATTGVWDVSLDDAIARGLKYNLGLLTSEHSTRLSRAARLRALSELLPTITARASETGQQVNLAAFGFRGFPAIPNVAGPFQVFDARAYLSQSVLDFTAINNNRAASENLSAAQHSLQNARDSVVFAVISLYLQAVAGGARIEAAQAQVNTSQALYNTAIDLRKAGVAPGIDVLRAQVELQVQQQRLILVRNEFEKQKLNLARAIGLPLGQQFSLADQVSYTPAPPITQDEGLRQAYRTRADYQSAMTLVRAAESSRKAAESERLPSLSFEANYGDIGNTVLNSHGTFAVAGALRIPIFLGARVRADVIQAEAQLDQRRAEAEDVRGRIDAEVRTAFLDLRASGDQVQVAGSSRDLAAQQLNQARDRFAAGVANNLEVVQAQQAVAQADENYISSLYGYNVAKASLARSLGNAEQNYKSFLRGMK